MLRRLVMVFAAGTAMVAVTACATFWGTECGRN